MNMEMLVPGDKIARCPYCSTVVDLPDEPAPNIKTTEVEEEEHGQNYRIKRTVKVTEQVSHHTIGDPSQIDDLMENAFNGFDARFSSATKEVRADSVGAIDLDSLPPEIAKMVRNATERPVEIKKEAPPPRTSWWKRLLGG